MWYLLFLWKSEIITFKICIVVNESSTTGSWITFNKTFTTSSAAKSAFLEINNLGYKNELKLENIYYNNNLINLDIYAKFVNADD